jgi:hypothetical protein
MQRLGWLSEDLTERATKTQSIIVWFITLIARYSIVVLDSSSESKVKEKYANQVRFVAYKD